MKVHYSSKTPVWETPQDFFEKLNAEFGITTDVCALAENTKCEQFYSPEQDGLAQDWKGVCWMNPPYGREIPKWVKKAYDSAIAGDATTICLLPARTDTRWWHDYAMKGEIRFIKGRLRFGGMKDNAPFPNAVVIFRARES